MNFEWEDRNGYHEVTLYDKGEELANMCFWDFTNPNQLEFDKAHKYTRAFAFQVNFCDDNGHLYETYFDEYKHYGENGNPIHTVDEIKKWCEEYLYHQNDGKIGIKNHQNDG